MRGGHHTWGSSLASPSAELSGLPHTRGYFGCQPSGAWPVGRCLRRQRPLPRPQGLFAVGPWPNRSSCHCPRKGSSLKPRACWRAARLCAGLGPNWPKRLCPSHPKRRFAAPRHSAPTQGAAVWCYCTKFCHCCKCAQCPLKPQPLELERPCPDSLRQRKQFEWRHLHRRAYPVPLQWPRHLVLVRQRKAPARHGL